MQLIGMLDSPYVRRVAVAMRLLELPFRHRPLSVFRMFEQFSAISPVVKAPTLVCDDGTVLIDSALILDYLEMVAGRSLWPAAGADRLRALRVAGLALATCEKSVQIVYEGFRPDEQRSGSWVDRVSGQLAAALGELEGELARAPLADDEARITHAGIATAIAWRFTQLRTPDLAPPARYPRLAAYGDRVEALPAFIALPPDETVDASTPPAC